jgi:hypothetical protein
MAGSEIEYPPDAIVEATDRTQITLTRIADISQVAQCSTSEFLIVMALISDLARQVIPSNDLQGVFYCADNKE